MNAYLDIENSKTNDVITIKLPILNYRLFCLTLKIYCNII